MIRLLEIARAWRGDRAGATSLEYGIIAAGVSILIISGAQAIGLNLTGKFTSLLTGFK